MRGKSEGERNQIIISWAPDDNVYYDNDNDDVDDDSVENVTINWAPEEEMLCFIVYIIVLCRRSGG